METMDITNASSIDHHDSAHYLYSTENKCWVKRNDTNSTVVDAKSNYCYYGLSIVVPISTILVMSMVLAIVGNTLVILTILRHRGMRTRTNLLLGNLAVADILVAVLDMPISLVTIVKGDWIFSHIFCDFNGFAVGLGFMLSVHTLMWISIHKYVSITRPFSRSVTWRKITLMILAAWTWAIFYNLTPTSLIGLTDTEYKLGASQCGPSIPRAMKQYIHSGINTIVNLILPITIMTFCYYRIFREVKDHLKRMRDFADVSACNSLIEQKQITETLCIVLSVFVLFWMPYIAYSMSLVFLGKKYVPVIFNPIAYTFGYMNSACNPIIYALRSPSFRKGFRDIICGVDRRRGFSGSTYGRQDSIGSMGRMVHSFRQSLFRTDSPRKPALQNRINYRTRRNMQPSLPATVALVSSGIDGSASRDLPCGQINNSKTAVNILYPHEEEEEEDPKRKVSSTSNNINSEFKINIIQDINRHPKQPPTDSLGELGGSDSQKLLKDTSSCNLPQETDQKIDLERDIPIGIQVTFRPDSSEKKNISYSKLETGALDHSLIPQTSNCNQNDFKMSTSQPNIALLPSQSLNIRVDKPKASSSNHDILVTTLEIRDNQIRSVSVGDISVTCSASQDSSIPCTKPDEPLVPKELSPRELSKVKRQFVWQPSVDNLYGSPILSRRKYHSRRLAFNHRVKKDAGQPHRLCECGYGEEAVGTSVKGSPSKNLKVPYLIQNFKKSLTDMFQLDDDMKLNSRKNSIQSGEKVFWGPEEIAKNSDIAKESSLDMNAVKPRDDTD